MSISVEFAGVKEQLIDRFSIHAYAMEASDMFTMIGKIVFNR